MVRSPAELKADRKLVVNGGSEARRLPEEDFGVCAEAAPEVARVIEGPRTWYWRGGPKTHALEATFAALIGRRGAFFHNSGSAALQTGLYALGVDRQSTVALSSSGFVSSLNAVYHSRSRPVFLPTNPDTLVVEGDVSGWVHEPIDVLLVTQFFGNVVDVDRLRTTSKTRHILEDASQALGSKLNGRFVGSHGEVASFSGSSKKLLGAGAGGINVYDDPELGERMRVLAHHGKGHTQYGEVPGFNFFGGEIEATLALAALKRFEQRARAQNESARRMISILRDADIQTAVPTPGLDCEVVWFDVGIILPEKWIGHRNWLVEALSLEGVPTWYYPALIDMPWVKPWMAEMGWWCDREEELLRRERSIWDRSFVIATQIPLADATRCAEITAEVLVGRRA